jgi:transcriptional regulator GlxA family with amidase domain
MDSRAARINAFVAENCTQHISLRAVSRALGLSCSSVQRALRDEGMKFRTAVALARLERAGDLVRQDPTMKIEAISLSVGWKSRRSLYQAIRQHSAHVTLIDWRRATLTSTRSSHRCDLASDQDTHMGNGRESPR